MIDIKKQARMLKAKKKNIMQTFGNNGVRLFKIGNFNAQGFIDEGVQKWKPKKKPNKYKILVGKSRKMKGTINYIVQGGQIWFRSLMPYARVHNEGLRAGRGKGFMMPKRQFMGESRALNKSNMRSMRRIIKQIMG